MQSLSAAGLTGDRAVTCATWYGKLPSFFTDSLSPNVGVVDVQRRRATGNPGGTDGAVFACYGTPSFGMGAVGWNYGTYTWHTNRDTYDKVVFDDLKHNATLAAMMAYLASEDPAVHPARAVAGQLAGKLAGATAERLRAGPTRGSREQGIVSQAEEKCTSPRLTVPAADDGHAAVGAAGRGCRSGAHDGFIAAAGEPTGGRVTDYGRSTNGP